jgi:GntR family transcriptional repressor for pyruvate dehydrogenase complex
MSTTVSQRAARIADQLLELIQVSKLNPGDRLPPERQLSELLEVSRPSLREALHILQAQGLVAIKHGQGTFVEEPLVAQELRAFVMSREHDLNELYDAREVLEIPAARWAAIADADVIDYEQLKFLDAKFHLTIVGIAKNRFLNQTLHVLQEVMGMSMETTLRLPGRIEISAKEHNAILSAIERGDGNAAAKLTHAHIAGARQTALADAKDQN